MNKQITQSAINTISEQLFILFQNGDLEEKAVMEIKDFIGSKEIIKDKEE